MTDDRPPITDHCEQRKTFPRVNNSGMILRLCRLLCGMALPFRECAPSFRATPVHFHHVPGVLSLAAFRQGKQAGVALEKAHSRSERRSHSAQQAAEPQSTSSKFYSNNIFCICRSRQWSVVSRGASEDQTLVVLKKSSIDRITRSRPTLAAQSMGANCEPRYLDKCPRAFQACSLRVDKLRTGSSNAVALGTSSDNHSRRSLSSMFVCGD
jgi:hypothetical protein